MIKPSLIICWIIVLYICKINRSPPRTFQSYNAFKDTFATYSGILIQLGFLCLVSLLSGVDAEKITKLYGYGLCTYFVPTAYEIMCIKLYAWLEMSTVKKANVIHTLEDFLSWCKLSSSCKKNPLGSVEIWLESVFSRQCDEVVTASKFNVSERYTNSRKELINHSGKKLIKSRRVWEK